MEVKGQRQNNTGYSLIKTKFSWQAKNKKKTPKTKQVRLKNNEVSSPFKKE